MKTKLGAALALFALGCTASTQPEVVEEASANVPTASVTATAEATATVTAPAVTASASAQIAPSATTPPDAKLDTITFVKRVPVVGDVETVEKLSTLKLAGVIKTDKGDVDYDSTDVDTLVKTEECMKVEGKSCVKMKVTYKQKSQKKTANGQGKDETSIVSSKTYIVEQAGQKITVTTPQGSAPPEKELAEVTKDYNRFGQSAKVLAAFPDKPVKVGDSLDGVAKALAENASGPDAKLTVKEAKVVVKDIRLEKGKKIVTLEMKIAVEGNDPKSGSIKLGASGLIDVLADGAQPIKRDLTGPMEIKMPKGKGKLSGTMVEKSTSTYSW